MNRLKYGTIPGLLDVSEDGKECPCCGKFGIAGVDIKDRLMISVAKMANKNARDSLAKSHNPNDKKKIPKPDNLRFSVLSFQVLAQSRCNRIKFPLSKPSALKWKHRSRRVLNEILARQSDILCLQGIEECVYTTFWVKQLRKRGYKGVFSLPCQNPANSTSNSCKKPQESKDIKGVGCAVFYASERFRMLRKVECKDLKHSTACIVSLDINSYQLTIASVEGNGSIESARELKACLESVKELPTLRGKTGLRCTPRPTPMVFVGGDLGFQPNSDAYAYLFQDTKRDGEGLQLLDVYATDRTGDTATSFEHLILKDPDKQACTPMSNDYIFYSEGSRVCVSDLLALPHAKAVLGLYIYIYIYIYILMYYIAHS
ncbi:hypothetical protein AAMO2058_000625100 [Amorphochlora amoebiformis]